MTDTIKISRELRPVLSMILNALDRDAAEGKAARGEMAAELRALLATPPADTADMGGQAGEAALQEWARDRFSFAGRYKGPIYGNTDWATARAMHADLLGFYAQRDAQHRQQAGKLVEALRKIHFRADCFVEDDMDMRVPSIEAIVRIADEALADWEKTSCGK